jgi:small-conductance mechanosensitive channel
VLPVAAGTTPTVVINHGLTALDWIEAGIVLVAGIVAGQLLRRFITRRFSGEEFEPRASLVAARFVGLVVSFAAFFYSLSLLGIRLGPLLGAVGIGGIAVALAAQSMLADLIASILLQTRRPFRRGDQIATNDHDGRVEDVNFRTVVLRSYDGQKVFLPASKVLNNPIVNYTVLGRRRSCLAVGIGYDTDVEQARSVLLRAVTAVDGVHHRPAPEVLVREFGESTVNLDVLFWHDPDTPTTRRMVSAVAVAVKQALDAAGIDMPFPQRVLHLNGSRPAPPERPTAPPPPAAEAVRWPPSGSNDGSPRRTQPESPPPPPR